MEKEHFGFKKIYWENIRDKVKSVNAELAAIIDKIDPGKNYPLVIASYRFGDILVKNGITYLPSNEDDLLPATDNKFQKTLKGQLSYSPIPLMLTLKNANEVFIDTSARIIPLNLFYPGNLLGLFESLDYLFSRTSSANGMLGLAMRFVGRKQEYKADAFAIKAGFGEGLLSFLDKLKNMEFEQAKELFAKLSATHPPTMLRIGELEKLLTTLETNPAFAN